MITSILNVLQTVQNDLFSSHFLHVSRFNPVPIFCPPLVKFIYPLHKQFFQWSTAFMGGFFKFATLKTLVLQQFKTFRDRINIEYRKASLINSIQMVLKMFQGNEEWSQSKTSTVIFYTNCSAFTLGSPSVN